MSLFSKNVIKDNKNAVITVGKQNIISVSQKLSEVKEVSLTNQSEEWSKVVEQINLLQKAVNELPDEYEELRDQHLIPTLSKAKKEAKTLTESPAGKKEGFIENFKSFCDLTLKITEVAEKVAPYVTVIATLIGITF